MTLDAIAETLNRYHHGRFDGWSWRPTVAGAVFHGDAKYGRMEAEAIAARYLAEEPA